MMEVHNSASDPVRHLPRELVYATFRLLDIWDRVAVSQVARDWRAVALADPFLWNEANLTPADISPKIFAQVAFPHLNRRPVLPTGLALPKLPPPGMLLELLARSYPLPFTLTWSGARSPFVPHDVVTVIAQHMCRMQALALKLAEPDFNRLLEIRAPLLRSFRCARSSTSCDFPTRWDAPLLETLELRPIRIPAGMQPMPSVRHLSAYAELDLGDAGTRLFAIFPSLCSLKIDMFTARRVPSLSDPPMSLTRIDLRADRGSTAVYAAFLRACVGRNIQTLRFESASSCVEALELFTSVVSGTWCMSLDGREVYVTAPDENVAYTIICARPPSLSQEPRIAAHLARLASLTTHAQFLIDLDALENWSRTLPELRDMTIHFSNATLVEPRLPLPGHSPIGVLRLEAVTFSLSESMASCQLWVTDVFPEFLRLRFRLARPRLAIITIDTQLECGPEGAALEALRALTDLVRVNLLGHDGKKLEYGDYAT